MATTFTNGSQGGSLLDRLWGRRQSLSARYVGLILTILVVSSLLLGAAVTIASVRNAAFERLESIEYSSKMAAAALMPVIADQDSARVEAQLRGMMRVTTGLDIQCIEIEDAAGNVLAESSDGCTCNLVEPSRGLLDVFTKPQVNRIPIEVEGMHVATVSIQFRPTGLDRAVRQPAVTMALVLSSAMLVAGLWGGWLVLRSVVEPIGELRDAAESIANGERDVRLERYRNDEIGELAASLQAMTAQLQKQELELMESYNSLESAFHDKAELAERLERTMRLKSDFVAVASHELRSPLAVMRLFAEMLEDSEFGEMDPQLADAVESIVSATTRLSSIVSSLMDVALLERGLMSLEYSDVALDDLVEQAVEDARLVGAQTDVDVVIGGSLPEVVVRGDAIRIRQVLDNLLSNAIKYSAGPSEVTVAMSSDDDRADIGVTDRGTGIQHSEPDRIFEMFARGDTADNTGVAGIGLGLPISERIARAHGGSIVFEPNPEGQGTVFHLLLPLGAHTENDTLSLA